LDATTADNLEAARPLMDALRAAQSDFGNVWLDMDAFVDEHVTGKTRRRAAKFSLNAVYSKVYERARPSLEAAIAEKEAEIESLLDGFAGLTPKMKDRVNKRLEALQEGLDALQCNLRDLRIPWEYLQADLSARQEALDRATAILNQEGHFRQKAEVLRTVVAKIVYHFRRVGKRSALESIEITPAEDAAVRPLTFPASLLTDSRLRAFA
jgi:hypothetical protein